MKWAAPPGRPFARETKARDEGKEPLLLTFPGAVPGEGFSIGEAGEAFPELMTLL